MNRHFVALSGLSIVIVVLNHSIHMGTLGIQKLGLPQAEGLEHLVLVMLSGLGTFAVPTFLFTSGSFVAYAARRTPPALPWSNVWAAVKRILWPYVVWSIVFYIYVYFRKAEGYTLWGYVQNLIVGYPFHFIPILLFYYVCSPVMVRLTPRFGYVLLAALALYQAFLIGLVHPSTYGLSVPDWTDVLVPPVLGRPMARWGIFFPLGLVYSLKAKEIAPWLQRFKIVSAVTTGALFLLLILHVGSELSCRKLSLPSDLLVFCSDHQARLHTPGSAAREGCQKIVRSLSYKSACARPLCCQCTDPGAWSAGLSAPVLPHPLRRGAGRSLGRHERGGSDTGARGVSLRVWLVAPATG